MAKSAGITRIASSGSLKCKVLLVAAFFLHVAAASTQATLDEESFQQNQKEALLTPALRYRRYSVLQIEDKTRDKTVSLVGRGTESQAKPEITNRLLNIDMFVWGRLLQSDGSMSMPTSTAPSPVVAPTKAPTPLTPAPSQPPQPICSPTNRSDTIIGLLEVITPELDTVTPSSPQGMALNWILNEDDTDPCLDSDSVRQRYALATLFFSTSGASWFNASGWLSMESECSWYGVLCSDSNDVERFELGMFARSIFQRTSIYI